MRMGKGLLCLLAVLFCFGSTNIDVCAAEKERSETELLILVDNSQSVINNNKDEKAWKWAEEICAYTYGTNVKLTYFSFDDIETYKKEAEAGVVTEQIKYSLYNDKIISIHEGNIEEDNNKDYINTNMEKLKAAVDYQGEFTDFEEAIMAAEVYFEKKSVAENQFILILTDGWLDFDNKNFENDIEKKSRCRFQKAIADFAKADDSGERGVILTGMSQDCSTYVTYEKINKENVLYFPIDEGGEKFEKAIYEILAMMNIPIEESKAGRTENGRIDFQIDSNCCRAIINIRKLEKNEELKETAIKVKYDGAENPTVNKVILTHSAFLYIEDPKPGAYQIIISQEGNKYDYEIVYQKSYVLDNVELLIFEEDKEAEIISKSALPKEYMVSGGFTIGMKLDTQGGEQINRSDYTARYWMKKIDGEDIGNLIEMGSSTSVEYKKCGSFTDDPSVPKMLEKITKDEGRYVLRLQVSSGGKAYFSKPVIVSVEGEGSTEIIEEKTVNLKIEENKNLEDFFVDLEEDAETINIVIKQRSDSKGNEDTEFKELSVTVTGVENSSEYFKVENKEICFYKTGEYSAELCNKEREIIKKIKFIVSGRKCDFLRCLKEILERFGIL